LRSIAGPGVLFRRLAISTLIAAAAAYAFGLRGYYLAILTSLGGPSIWFAYGVATSLTGARLEEAVPYVPRPPHVADGKLTLNLREPPKK
jgi:hypothetical protein